MRMLRMFFASRTILYAWLANSTPALSMKISQMVSIMKEKHNKNTMKYIKPLHKPFIYAHKYLKKLRYHKLGISSICIVGYSEATFENNYDLSSKPVRTVLLVDADENTALIAIKSYQSRQVLHRVLAGKEIEFTDLFDESFAIRDTIAMEILNIVQLHLLINSKKLI